MLYKVLAPFKDLQDNCYSYRTGDTFPRSGLKVGKKRIVELSSTENKRGFPLIEAVESEMNTNGKIDVANGDLQRAKKLVR